MKVLVCGARDYGLIRVGRYSINSYSWDAVSTVTKRLQQLPEDATIIQGGAAGADFLARVVAMRLGLNCKQFDADWRQYGRAAGPVRNRQMLDEQPDLVIAFHPDLSKSKGTADCIKEAKRRGIPVEVIS